MILFWLITLVAALPIAMQQVNDPAPVVLGHPSDAERYECEFVDSFEAERRRPGQASLPNPRGDNIDRQTVICEEPLMQKGQRRTHDELLLRNLDVDSQAFAQLVEGEHPELLERTWLVESFHHHAEVAHKLRFAGKNALMAQGLRVSDRIPSLAAADVDILGRMPPMDSYPHACRRYHENGTLGPNDALLAIVLLDRRETIVHGGICADGGWRWLR